MKKVYFITFLALLIAFMTTTASAYSYFKDLPEYTTKGEILRTTEKYDMFYKSEEFKKIIANTATKEELAIYLNRMVKKLSAFPEYEKISVEDLKYDLNDYYVSPMLNISEFYEKDTNQFYHQLVIPVYLYGKNVDNLWISYRKDYNSYCLASHSSYRAGYSKFAESPPTNAGIFDFVNTKDKITNMVKIKLGEDTEILKQYLLLGFVNIEYKGIQEDNLFIETNKGVCIFVSASCSFKINEDIDFKNNTLYTIDEYYSKVQPKLYPELPKQVIEYNEDGSIKWETVRFGGAVNEAYTDTLDIENDIMDKKFLGIKGGYVIIPSAVVLLIVGTTIVFIINKKKKA